MPMNMMSFRRHGRKRSKKAFVALLNRMDDLEDKMALIEAELKPASRKDVLPMDLAERILDGEPPLRIWREHRKLSLKKLSTLTGISTGYLGDIDAGNKPGSAAALKKCARALGVDMEDLVRA
jgi:Helix-turn-helix domain